MFRRITALILACVLLTGGIPATVFAAEAIERADTGKTATVLSESEEVSRPTSGTCGENVTWAITDDVLRISGTGPMTEVPNWVSFLSASTVIIENGVTAICENAFEDCLSLERAEIAASVKTIGNKAFSWTNTHEMVFYGSPPSLPKNGGVFTECGFTLYYPANNPDWTSEVIQNYNANAVYITWVPYNNEGAPNNGTYTSPQESVWYDIWCAGGSMIDPVTGFTLNVGTDTYPTGDDNRAKASIPYSLDNEVSVSKDGYITCQIPAELIYTCREIVMYPADTAVPFVQFAAFRENGETWYTNLAVSRDSVMENAMTAYEMYVDINWNGAAAGEVWLLQGGKRIDLYEGKNDSLMLGGTLTYDGGRVYLYFSTASGDTYCQPLHLDIYRDSSTNITISGGDITSGINPKSNDEDEVWGTLKLTVDVLKDMVPVEVRLSPSSITSGTFEATFGIEIPVTEKKHILYDMIKNGLDSDKLGSMDFKDAQKLVKQLEKEGAKVSAQANKFVFETKGKFLGYFTGVYTLGADGNIADMTFSDSGIMAGWEGEFTTARQHFTSGVPWFWELKAKIEAALKLKLNEEYDGSQASIAPAAAEAEIELGAGVAAGLHDIASLGVSGSGVTHVDGQILPFDADSVQIYANYKFNLGDFRVGPFNGTILTLASDKYYLLRNGVWFPDAQEQAQLSSWNLANTAEQTMQQTSRAYLSRGSVFHQSIPMTTGMARTVQNGAAGSWTIKTNTYTSAEPRIVALDDGRLLMVWTDDPGTQVRPAGINRAALYYSIYSEGAWSEPAMIHDDGTTDLAPVLKVVDGEVYLVWVNINAVLADDCSYEEFCAAMDIAYARFDSLENVFTDISAVDTDEKTDTLADVTVVNGVPTVVWLRSGSGLLVQEGTGAIHAAQLVDGSWETTVLCDGLQSVDKLYADNAENELGVFFAQDTDGDYATIDDRELFRAGDSGVVRLTDNETADLKPVVVNDEMYWYCDGMLTDGTHTLTMAEATDRYSVVTNGTSTAVLYHQIKEDHSTSVYAHYLDENGWSDAVELFTAPGYITSFGAAMLPDGTLYIMANEIAAADGNLENADLMLYTAGLHTDLRVHTADYQALTLVPGGALEIQAEVSNPGTERVEAVCVQMFHEDTLLHETQMECDLAAGGSGVLDLEYPIAADFTAEALQIKILPAGQTDGNEADNAVAMPIYRSDVSVEDVQARRNGETTAVTAYIANRGLDTLSDVVVSVRGQTADAEALATVTIASIAAGAGEVVCLEVDAAEGSIVYVTAEIADAENMNANNAGFAPVVPADDASVQDIQAHEHTYTVEQTAPTCTQEGYSTYTCQLCRYSYVDDYVATVAHTADKNIPAEIVAPTCTEFGYTVYTCAVCASTYETDYVYYLGHDLCECRTDDPSCPDCAYTASTCVDRGWITYTCRRDGCGERQTIWLDYAHHTMDESMPGVTTAATCTEQGYTTFFCTVCQTEVTDFYVNALGHDWCGCETENAACDDCTYTAATCTENGGIHYVCRRENCTETTDVYLWAGHTPDDSQTVEHLYYTDYVCTVCGEAYVVWDDIRLSHMELPETGISSISFVNGGDIGWGWNETTERFESRNVYADRTTAQTTMEIHSTADMVLSFDYGVSSEANYDFMDIVAEIGGEVITIAQYMSGTQTGSFSCELPAGKTALTFTYVKDGGVSAGSDVGWFSNLKLERSGSAGSVTYTSASISLAGDIGVNYYAQLSDDIVADAGAYMQFTMAGQTQIVPLSEAVVSTDANGITTHRFTCKVAAKQMTENITGQMYLGDGTAVGEAKVYSVKAYCDAAIPAYSQYEAYADLVALMKAMLNYGGYSQTHFGYNTENLANAGLDLALPELTADDVDAYAHGATGSESGIRVASVSLLLESTTTIRFYFELDGNKSIDEYTFFVDGVETKPVAGENGQYYVDKVGVAAKDLDEMVTVTVGGLTAKYCGLSYVRQVAVLYPSYYSANLVNVAKALYAYNQAANAYFG